VIVGAVEGASGTLSNMHDRLILRPFPQTVEDSREAQVFNEWRAAIISLAGFTVFLAGNKLDDSNSPIPADGVREEFDIGITAPLHSYPIPVGATGHVAQQIWQQVSQEPQRFYSSINVARELEILGEPTRTDEELLQAIFDIIRKVHRNRAT